MGRVKAMPHPELIAGRYRVLRALGKGGMGTVWLGRDETLNREVAIKQIGLLPGASSVDASRAMREARLAAALHHENAVSAFDVVDEGDATWLVMEYVPSRTLAELVGETGGLPPNRLALIGSQVASALATAHSLGIVHRDVKPGNVLVSEGDLAKISDFGIARGHQDDQLTQVGMMTGTPAYFSPELARGAEPSAASDVWALGVTLYTAVEGEPPHPPQSSPLAMLSTITRDPLRPPRRAGPLASVLEGMLAHDPDARWSMSRVAAELEDIAGGSVVEATTVVERGAETAYPAEQGQPRRGLPLARPVLATAAVLVLLLALVVAWVLTERDADRGTTAGGPSQEAPTRSTESAPNRGQNDRPETGDGGVSGVSAPSKPAAFTRSYYRIVPEDLDRGWSLLDPGMQEEIGRASYDSFWRTIADVRLGEVRPVGDGAVRYEIEYVRTDGSTSDEVKEITLRPAAGSFLITSDSTVG